MRYLLLFFFLFLVKFSTAHSFLQSENASITATDTRIALPSFKYEYRPVNYKRGGTNAAEVGAYILGFAGGAMVGYPLGTMLGGGDPNWVVAGIGAGLIAIAIPLSIIGERQKNGYSMANGHNKDAYASNARYKEIYLVAKAGQIGVRIQF